MEDRRGGAKEGRRREGEGEEGEDGTSRRILRWAGRVFGEWARREVESEGGAVFLVLREVRCCAKRGEEEEEEEEQDEEEEEEEEEGEVGQRLAFRCGAPSREELIGGTILVIGRVEGVRRVAGPRVPLVLTGIR